MLKKLRFILSRTEKNNLVFLSLGSIILSLSEVLSIGILIPIIWLFINPEKIHTSIVLNKLYQAINPVSDKHFLISLSIAAIAIFLIKIIYSIFMLFMQQCFIAKVYNRLTGNVLEYYLNKEYSFHLMSNSSVLFKNLSAEVSQFTSYFLMPIIAISSDFIILLGIFIFMFVSYPAIASFLFFAAGGLLMASNVILKKKINSYARGRNIYSEEYYKSALETLHAIKEIQVFDVRGHFMDKFNKAIKNYNDNYIKYNIASSLSRHILEAFIFISIMLVIVIDVSLNTNYKEILPMLTIIGIIILRLLPLISRITTNINAFHFSFNSTELVYDIVKDYRMKMKDKSSDRQALVDANDYSISIENITFNYTPDGRYIFEDFNAVIPSEKITAFIGETGSGKSTLIDIIMGLLIPEKGKIYFGRDLLSPKNIHAYRKKIGYVPQNIFLFDDTIGSNIAFGIPSRQINSKILDSAIKIAQLESFINELPQGLNTRIGERGIRISGGQRQRIGIARALYRDPGILIFDEATSALDIHTEARLYRAIKNLGKTIIMVTHRLATIENADIIYILDHGSIIEKGTFEELVEKSAFFKKIAEEKETPILENG